MPIAVKYKKVLKAMTKQYCKGKLDKKYSGILTCKKAASVFYATMKKKGIDYTETSGNEDWQKILDMINQSSIVTNFGETKKKDDFEESRAKNRKIVDQFIEANKINEYKGCCGDSE